MCDLFLILFTIVHLLVSQVMASATASRKEDLQLASMPATSLASSNKIVRGLRRDKRARSLAAEALLREDSPPEEIRMGLGWAILHVDVVVYTENKKMARPSRVTGHLEWSNFWSTYQVRARGAGGGGVFFFCLCVRLCERCNSIRIVYIYKDSGMCGSGKMPGPYSPPSWFRRARTEMILCDCQFCCSLCSLLDELFLHALENVLTSVRLGPPHVALVSLLSLISRRFALRCFAVVLNLCESMLTLDNPTNKQR